MRKTHFLIHWVCFAELVFFLKLSEYFRQGGVMRLVSDSMPTNRFLEFLQVDHHPQAVSTEYTKWFSEISSRHHPPTTVSTGSTKWISAYTSRHHLFCYFSDQMRDKSNSYKDCHTKIYNLVQEIELRNLPVSKGKQIDSTGRLEWRYGAQTLHWRGLSYGVSDISQLLD